MTHLEATGFSVTLLAGEAVEWRIEGSAADVINRSLFFLDQISMKGFIPQSDKFQNFQDTGFHHLLIGLPLRAVEQRPQNTLFEMQADSGHTFSGGEQQMLDIGRALMSKPAMLLLDEPSIGLAPLVVEGSLSHYQPQ